MEGRYVTLDRLGVGHSSALWKAFANAPHSLWTYMTNGPFAHEADLTNGVSIMVDIDDWQPYAICVAGRPVGFACLMRIDPAAGAIEIGSIVFSPDLQRTTAATEAIFLLIDHVFELGYRRCEWKCDDLNAPSRAAALRLGFTYEGTFRFATNYKGRSRDTAWYAIIDRDWPAIRAAFDTWLAPENFDEGGNQRSPLRTPAG